MTGSSIENDCIKYSGIKFDLVICFQSLYMNLEKLKSVGQEVLHRLLMFFCFCVWTIYLFVCYRQWGVGDMYFRLNTRLNDQRMRKAVS